MVSLTCTDNTPLVSIVTPSYNQGQFIEATLLSVKTQDYPNIEHLVIDGGSSDNTLEILKKYEKEYNLNWTSERDKGQSDAVNKGFARAHGEIIGWLNSDDVYFDKQIITYIVNTFKKLPDIEVLYGDGIVIDENNLILRVTHTIPRFSYNRLLRADFIPQPSTFFRRKVIEEHRLDINIDLAMDYEYYLRIAKNGVTFKHVNKLLSAFRSYRAAKSISRSQELRAELKRVKELCGQRYHKSYYLACILDDLIILLLKVYGIRTIIALKANYKRRNLAFSAKFDSTPRAVFRQLSFDIKRVFG